MSESTYEGRCFCGAVGLTVTGSPKVMGYCHCTSCREWSAGPVNAFTLWSPDAVKVTKGQDQIGMYKKTENSHRKFCKKCGGHVFSEHPSLGMTDVYAAILPTLPFRPTVHISYGEKVLSVKDGLPKFRDAPKEFGGSGETLPD